MERVREEKTREDYATLDYLVCFVDRDDRNWWDYVFRTREGFRHCFALQWCEWSKRWLMVDWRQSRTDFTVFFDFEIELILRRMHETKGTVVKFTGPKRPDDAGGLITYCSNILSRFLGLGNPVILTPYGLYRRLVASGGEVVFSWRDVAHEQQAQTVGPIEGTGTHSDRTREAAPGRECAPNHQGVQ